MEQLKTINSKLPELIKVAKVVFPKWTDDQIENYVLSELSFLKERMQLSEGLQECTAESLLQCIKKSLLDNVSLNTASNLVYIQKGSVTVKGQRVAVAQYGLSPEGKISVTRQSGMVLDITRPKLKKNSEGKVIGGTIEILKPSTPQPRWEEIEFDESDINRWMAASTKKNNGKTNPLYTNGVAGGIDSEFMRSKILKHALGKGLGTNKNETLIENKTVQMLPVNTEFEPVNDALFLEENNQIESIEQEEPDNNEMDFSNL
jgi:hypothetical protein